MSNDAKAAGSAIEKTTPGHDSKPAQPEAAAREANAGMSDLMSDRQKLVEGDEEQKEKEKEKEKEKNHEAKKETEKA